MPDPTLLQLLAKVAEQEETIRALEEKVRALLHACNTNVELTLLTLLLLLLLLLSNLNDRTRTRRRRRG